MCDCDYRLLTGALDVNVNKKQLIINEVCKHLKTSFEKINVKSRDRELVYARQMAMYFLLNKKYSTTQAGEPFRQDHCTALHARKTINNLASIDKQVRSDIEQISLKLININD